MKVIEAEFLEPVRNPHKGPGGSSEMLTKARMDGSKPITGRLLGPGIVLESETSSVVTVVPWGNVRYALVEKDSLPAGPGRPKAKSAADE